MHSPWRIKPTFIGDPLTFNSVIYIQYLLALNLQLERYLQVKYQDHVCLTPFYFIALYQKPDLVS